jgi:hypothetical protein
MVKGGGGWIEPGGHQFVFAGIKIINFEERKF